MDERDEYMRDVAVRLEELKEGQTRLENHLVFLTCLIFGVSIAGLILRYA